MPQPTLEQNSQSWWLRLVNWSGTSLRNRGVPLANLDVQTLMSAAERQTQLSDWGEEDFQTPLKILLNSLEQEADLSFIGRSLMQQYCVRLLENRLQMQNDFKQHPEILQTPIHQPLFILGLPRTGTTLLHRLLAQDPDSRWLHLWELLSPSPPPNLQTSKTDSRIQKAKQLVRRYSALAPALATAHYIDPQEPEECNNLFEHIFMSILFELRVNVPSYTAWLEAQDMVLAYQYHRRQLQLLGWQWSANRWLLKAPAHLLSLDALLTVYPDARIIQTHRDPLQVLPSICSLAAILHKVYAKSVDLSVVGEHWLHRLSRGVQAEMKVRERIDTTRFFDVNYNDLARDPVVTIQQIYEYFGYDFSPKLAARLHECLVKNPQHKHGVHRYSLEQFHLDAEQVNRAFADYRQRFSPYISNNL